MTTFAVLATGPSMNQAQADFVRGKCRAVAISDAYKLAPWADALVSNDRQWWSYHQAALKFAGRKFAGTRVPGTEYLLPDGIFKPGCNSGLQGMRVAQMLGAKRILLLGFDMHGTHFFGPHPSPLRNTSARRFATHILQFNGWRGCEVINCTQGSAIKRFPYLDLADALAEMEMPCAASR